MKAHFSRSLLLILALALTACPTTNPKKDTKKPAATADQEAKSEDDQVDFQAFVGRLRRAVRARDANMIASMMTPNFGYVLGATAAEDRTGLGVFQYWNENNLWPELEGILAEKFVPNENFMVAPPQFVQDPDNYTGYRAGIQRVSGSWKFAYFVNGSNG